MANDTLKESTLCPLDHIVEIGIDKLKCCIRSENVDDSFTALLQEKFELLAHRRGTHRRSSQRQAFRQRMSVRVGGEYVLIECQPNMATYPWAATFEFNPNPYLRKGEAAINNLTGFLRFLFGYDAHRILSHAFVSELHVNIDTDINPLQGTLVDVKGKRSGAKVMYDFDGEGILGSLYIGVLNSDRRLAIYNKAAEVLHRELGPRANRILAALASDDKWDIEVSKLKQEMEMPERWRLEVRNKCKPKDAIPVLRIAEFASCFKDVRILHLPVDAEPFNDLLGRLFIANARNDGIPRALRALDPNERRRFDRKLNQLPDADWFNADLLHEAIGQVIAKLAPLFAPPPPSRLKVADNGQHQRNAATATGGVVFRRTAANPARSGTPRNRAESEMPARRSSAARK
ncbi:hypothetical protein [Paraburkholderia sp. BL21I4N1]|uniref:hypothetical protein n=1 Tax=Paraburkholderia sp. BL21I4N1 TaxID=1938801 RepID=UPI000D42ECCA|nr:hypothetical protein [Paraburkholderia sp. BL21I4N1]PQV51910.1 hypothetical protein B0G83_104119 [Paraburkholderia sp. BL21I4N1]